MTIAMGRLEIETPDHVVLRFQLAGAGNRGFAAMADFLIASVLVYAMDFSFQKVTEIDPTNPDGWVNIGRAAVQATSSRKRCASTPPRRSS